MSPKLKMYLLYFTILADGQFQCRRSVVLRDKYCLLTHTAENNCINSHSIPRRLLRVSRLVLKRLITFL